jgi:hypothetical protein
MLDGNTIEELTTGPSITNRKGGAIVTVGRFQKYQRGLLRFFVSANNQVTLVGGAKNLQGVYEERTIVQPVNTLWGWTLAGNDVIVKRATNLAQTAQNFSSGAYFSAFWDEMDLRCCGGSGNPTHWTSEYTAGDCKWPDATKVIVTDVNYPTDACLEPPLFYDDCIRVVINLAP